LDHEVQVYGGGQLIRQFEGQMDVFRVEEVAVVTDGLEFAKDAEAIEKH
jgi:hypothetical protein